MAVLVGRGSFDRCAALVGRERFQRMVAAAGAVYC